MKLKKLLVLLLCLSMTSMTLAADFTPQGNINLRDVYNITGAPYVNASIYYGNGSQLTGVTADASTINHSLLNSLQGGNIAQYYHMNKSQHTEFIANIFNWITTWLIPDINSNYLYNDSTTIYFNETRLNDTGDQRYVNVDGDTMSGDLNMSNNNVINVENYTGQKINVTCCVYLGTIQSTDGNSIAVQPTGDVNDFFSFKTPADRPTIKREGGKYIYFESSNVNDVGISFRQSDTYSGTVNYEKDNHVMTLLGKNSPLGFKANSEYRNYILFETYNHQPQISVFNGTKLIINDSLEVVGSVNSTDWTNVSITESQISDLQTYRLQSWNNLTGIPHATPSDGDTTHFSLADEIYDWIIGFGYIASLVADTTPQLGGYLDANGQNIGSTADEIENVYVGDNTRIYFGDGQDASIYYNGTNLIISG